MAKNERMIKLGIAIPAIFIIFIIMAFIKPSGYMAYNWFVFISIIAVLCVSLGCIGCCFMGNWKGILIDGRNKISLSRLQMVLWTIIVISGLLAAVSSNIAYNQTLEDPKKAIDPLDIEIPPELWLLMGITTVSLVGSPLIKREIQDKGNLKTNTENDEAKWSDMFSGEETDNSNRLDLGKVQMFYLTLIIAFSYLILLFGQIISINKPDSTGIIAFPAVSSGMVALLGISNAGYLAYKAVPHVEQESAESIFKRGVDQGNLGDYKEAIELYEKAIKLDPKYAEAWHKKGEALGKLSGKQKEAQAAFKEAGKLYESKEKKEEAKKSFDMADQDDQEVAKALQELAKK
jgi:tetratricopeptide (TPR) repeat protein